jgi:hypothetical protein
LNNLKERNYSNGLCDGIILKWILKIYVVGSGLDTSGSEWGPVAGSCEHDNKTSDSIKCGKFLD